MQYTLALLALAASVLAQDPNQCTTDWIGKFEIATQNLTAGIPQGSIGACTSNPIITMQGTVLTDQMNSQAEVVSPNHQFQFDPKAQLQNHFYDSNFTACPLSGGYVLAHNGDVIFYSCNSGSFDNLYDQDIGTVCKQIYIAILPCDDNSHADLSKATAGLPINAGASTKASTIAPSTVSSPPVTSATSSAASVTPSTAPSTASSSTALSTIPTAAPIPVAATSAATSAAAAPYPTGNTTTTAVASTGAPSSTAPGSTTSKPLTAPASGASALQIGSTLGAVVAALAAFAML